MLSLNPDERPNIEQIFNYLDWKNKYLYFE
jgi:hypothetical protein